MNRKEKNKMVTTLIATIIHMQYGFELPEALWRGFFSALIVWVLGLAIRILYMLIAGAVSGLRCR